MGVLPSSWPISAWSGPQLSVSYLWLLLLQTARFDLISLEVVLAQLDPGQTRLLAAARVGHLSTADANGQPHVIPVCFAFDGRRLYSVLDQKPKRALLSKLRRVRNIESNPQVALVVDHYEEDWSNLRYILVSGKADLLVDGDERVEAIRLLRNKYPQYQDMDIDASPVIRITPDRFVTWGNGPDGS